MKTTVLIPTDTGSTILYEKSGHPVKFEQKEVIVFDNIDQIDKLAHDAELGGMNFREYLKKVMK